MKVISENLLNEIRTSVDIVDIVSDYVSLEPKGKNFFGICPFHDDNSPSMSVSREKQIYTCFSCGATGNVYNFVQNYENVSFLEAVKIIATKAGYNLNIDIKNNNNANSKYQNLYQIYDISKKLYQNNLNTEIGSKARNYLLKRNIDDEIIKKFEIGLSLKQHDFIYKLLKKKGFIEKDLIESGLINKNDYGYNDVYYNRIMFPLYDLSGQVIGYSGRIYDSDDTAKYVNTKETPIFKKGELLYNYHRAKEVVKRSKKVIIVEGFMDVIRLSTIGIDYAVASMGTAITKKQALLLKKLSSDIILCFDGDKAGLKATINCMNELSEIGVTPKIIRIKNNLDPDEFITKYGADAYFDLLENPINMVDFKLKTIKEDKDLNSSVDMAKYVNDVITEINKIDDDILKEITLEKLSKETDLDIEFLRKKIIKTKPKKVKIKKIKRDKYMKAECYLLYYMLKYPEVIMTYERKITYMPTDRYRFLAREIDAFYHSYQTINVADLISYLGENQLLINTVGEIENLDLNLKYTNNEIEDYIKTIREYNVKYECERLKKIMSNEENVLKKAEIAQKIIDLKLKENEYVE